MDNNLPTFSFLAVLLADKTIRIDVLGNDLPVNFLGMAFDLNIDGVQWNYQKYELGSIFHDRSAVLSLAAQRTDPQGVIFGVSLKRGAFLQDQKGVLVSFYFDVADFAKNTPTQNGIDIGFSRGILSVLDGTRKDIVDVIWQDTHTSFAQLIGITDIAQHESAKENLTASMRTAVLEENLSVEEVETQPTELFSAVTQDPLLLSGSSHPVFFWPFWIILIPLLLLLLSFLLFRTFKR